MGAAPRMILVVVAVGLLLAFANGANDNFKGAATLYGSGTSGYRGALVWATLTTALGSMLALLVARGLLAAFSGKGLVGPELAADPAFTGSVALAAGLTVFAAARIGMPISTTHSLIGALVGAGLMASPTGVDGERLMQTFLLPLLVSPVLALVGAGLAYPPLRAARRRLGVTQETCVCIGEKVVGVVPGSLAPSSAIAAVELPTLTVADEATCRVRYAGRVFGLGARRTLDAAHFLSAGALSFARGLNDTPKIAALLLAGGALHPGGAVALVGLFIAVGGITSARRVAETMSHRVTAMNPGQGFVANAVSSVLVIAASRFGVPVSTTHVSCGALFGIGAITRQAHGGTIGGIVIAWVVTLPLAAALGAGFAWVAV